MLEKELTKQESLNLITEMINQAKSNYSKGGSFFFLLWGWTIMLANFGHYYLARFTDFDQPYLVWTLTLPAAVISIIYSVRLGKKALVVTHLDRMYGQVWVAMGVGIIVSLLFMHRMGFNHNPVILLFAGAGTFISGRMLRFTPLVLGGIALWMAAVIGFSLPVVDQYLVGGIGILAGYLIPGYLLKNKEK